MRPSSIFGSTLRFARQLSLLIITASLCGPTLAERSAVAVYRCHINGVLTFSDRPCRTPSEVQEIDTDGINTSETPAVPKASGKSRKKTQAQRSGSGKASDPAKAAQACDRLTQSLRDIRSRMRGGYKASEGERLKEQQAKLKNQLRLARCS
jgi:hypothetical protein